MRRIAVLLCVVACSINALSQSADLRAMKSGQDVLLSWTGGTANFTVAYSTTPSFAYGNIMLADSIPSFSEPHVSALADNANYFYDVAGANEMSKAVAGGGYLPPPAPQLLEIYQYNTGTSTCTTTATNAGKIGQTICLKVKNPDTRAPNYNLIDFAGIVVSATALTDNGDGTYTLQTVIPADAKSGNISILANAIKSIEEKYFFIVAYDTYNDATAFRDLSSLAYEDSTGSIWAGDRGTKDKLLEIEVNGNVIERAGRLDPIVSDFTGDYVWYASSIDSSANQGTFTRWDAAANVSYNWGRSGDTASSNPSRPLAVAKDTATEFAFISDWKTGNVKKLRNSNTWPACVADFDYGAFTGTLSFNDPSGMRIDVSGNIYFTTTTGLYKIYPSESHDAAASGFSAAAGIDLTDESQILLADEGAGNIWAIQSAAPYAKAKIIQNLTQPVAVVQGTRNSTKHFYIAEHQRILDFSDQSIEMQPKRNIKALISAVHGLPYPEPAFQSEDSKVKIKLQVNPLREATVYFKVHDPPENSPYMGGANDDNYCYMVADASISPQPLITDSQGFGEITLTFSSNSVSKNCAGDNFYVSAHFDSLAQPETSRTGIITLWKRIYVEIDKMFVKGSFLLSSASSGSISMNVEDGSVFGTGDTIQVLDADNQSEPFGQIFLVDSVVGNTILLGSQTTNQEYTAGHLDYDDPGDRFGYVGLLVDASDAAYYPFWEASLEYTRQLFDSAFVEIVYPNKGSGPIPNPGWLALQPGNVLDNYSYKWWHPDNRNGQNYLHLIGAKDNPGANAYGQSPWKSGASYVYVEVILNTPGGNVGDTSLHELTHHFVRNLVNNCDLANPPSCYHCDDFAFAPPFDMENCEMNTLRDRTNDVLRFCIPHILMGNDLGGNPDIDESIRRQHDAVGRNWL